MPRLAVVVATISVLPFDLGSTSQACRRWRRHRGSAGSYERLKGNARWGFRLRRSCGGRTRLAGSLYLIVASKIIVQTLEKCSGGNKGSRLVVADRVLMAEAIRYTIYKLVYLATLSIAKFGDVSSKLRVEYPERVGALTEVV